MLKDVKLSRRVSKDAFGKSRDRLEIRLAALQRRARELGIPILIVFEGWDAAGKGTLINDLILALDPRGFTVHSTLQPTEEETYRPLLWPFWLKTPARGRITILDRSWYHRLLTGRCDRSIRKRDYSHLCADVAAFEKQLTDDGTLLVKLFLHISRKEQRRRLDKLRRNKTTAWRVTRQDLRRHRQYDRYFGVMEELLSCTHRTRARWTVIPAHDRRFATLKIFKTVICAVERQVARAEAAASPAAQVPPPEPTHRSETGPLDSVDLTPSLTRGEYREKLKRKQERLRELHNLIYLRRIPVVVVYEGRDAAGKGGNIRRLTQHLDPRGYEVVPVYAPNIVEQRYHYLWRFWRYVPKAGHITIFDRSWYGRVLVERVEGFATRAEWRRGYREISDMEAHWSRFGVLILKFWLEIDAGEQLRRFRRREGIAHKKWKITDEDWRNRQKADAYKAAADEMLLRTSRPQAPWSVVPANSKLYARIHVLDTVIRAIERNL